MNALTISVKIKGSCNIISGNWVWKINNKIFTLDHNDKNFYYDFDILPSKGWNKIFISHTEHPDFLTKLDTNGKIVDFSYVSIDTVTINDIKINKNLLENSGLNFTGANDKKLWYKCMGEPFIGYINFYYPVEHWPFAVNELSNKINW